MTSPAPSLAATIADHFPWRILAVDIAIPMAGYAVFAAMGNPVAGILFAGGWGIFRTLWEGIRQKSLPFFSSVTILFALWNLLLCTGPRIYTGFLLPFAAAPTDFWFWEPFC